VNKALKAVETILETTRHPVLPEDADHTYEDKFALVEVMTNTAIASAVTVLEKLGLKSFETALDWVHKEHRPVTLRFQLDLSCTFEKQTERKIVTSEQEVERTHGGSGLMGRIATQTENVKVQTTIQEFHWKVKTPYKLTMRSGDDEIELMSREDMATTCIVTGGGNKSTDEKPPPPLKETAAYKFDVNLSWLLQQMISSSDGQLVSQFSIDRLSEKCRTPSRNEDISRAMDFGNELESWASGILGLLKELELVVAVRNNSSSSAQLTDSNFREAKPFSPIVPLFENATVLAQTDFDKFLTLHRADLEDYLESFSNKLPPEGFISKTEGKIAWLVDHLVDLLMGWEQTIAYVEQMLQDQLIQAIGKAVTPHDFDEFMSFHAKKLLDAEYAPKPFSYAVRRENHYPDGMVSVEAKVGNKRDPIETTVRRIAGASNPSIFIPVNAATSVEIRGDRYVHGWMQHTWRNRAHVLDHYLVARAHQFSSFLVVVGVMGGPDNFIPKDAIILQNKDEVLIPLLTSTIPSAKEFKDSIASLSPEQKTFAQAFRKMQLESSVFGVCVIQIKPQLERLLRLSDGSLTKEIQLTQDLMSLFVDYQIPSDLLSFDGSPDAEITEKVASVKGYVKAVMDVIDGAKEKQLEEERKKAEIREQIWQNIHRIQ
jgi:hypothetical protein